MLQGVTTLGTIYSSSLFPGRCPSGEMLLLNYIGGATNRSVQDVRASHRLDCHSACTGRQELHVQAWMRTGPKASGLVAGFSWKAARTRLYHMAVHACSACSLLLLLLQASQDELVAQVDKDLRTMLLKPDAPKPRVVGVRVWPRAIPQFNVGHLDVLDKAKQVRGRCWWVV